MFCRLYKIKKRRRKKKMKSKDVRAAQNLQSEKLMAWLHFHPTSPQESLKFHLILLQPKFWLEVLKM